ncbi:hypothetical protein N7454_011252 [Penicillium verhagenii]|nr:hypothetical protein N7454_011252 [Penicillium verhagenii]
MAAADVRDMLDLPAEGQPRPHKKQKVVEKRPEGITRELYALLGERAPPIAINENKYKGRPKWMNKLRVRPWSMTPFTNNARSDGLVLNHWQRKHESTRQPVPDGTQMDVDKTEENGESKDEGKDEAPKPLEQEYSFAKYNIKARVPQKYSEEEYNRSLKHNDWDREETDYLMDLVHEYDLRWMIIADRYDYQPRVNSEADVNALVPAKRHRTMEQMKSRYYFVAATILAIEHPPSEMSEAEFEVHERMLKFDPDRERDRKELAALQINRTADEVREEAMLLEELKRITSNEQNFITERRELYSASKFPSASATPQPTNQAKASHSSCKHSSKQTRARSVAPSSDPKAVPSPVRPVKHPQRRTTASAAARHPRPVPQQQTKKGGAAAVRETQQPIRTLTPAEESRFGVHHHERVTAGVQFRSDRAQKLTQAKSNVQTLKLAGALAELEIPIRLFMPTERVCREFERLIQSVNLLLDARKVAEKVDSEIRVLEAARAEREKKSAPENGHPAVKTEAEDGHGMLESTAGNGGAAENEDEKAENDAGDADETPTKRDANHKRSASVLSGASDKDTKRQRR